MYHVATTLRILVAGTLGVVALGATHAAPGPEDIPWRLDHANVVVRNLAAARADFDGRTGGQPYRSPIPAGQKPPLP